MNKKILLISIISLMFIVFMSGSIFAATFTGLTISDDGVSVDSDTGVLEVFYTHSNIGSIDLGNWYQRNVSFYNWNYKIKDNTSVFYYVIYFDTLLDSKHKQVLDQILSKNFFDSTNFVKYCGSDRSTLITALNNVGIHPEFENISCGYNKDTNPNLQIKNGEFINKTTGAFYIYLLEYNVLRSRIFYFNYYANLKSISPYNGDLYTSQFIDDESQIFDSSINNYFTDKYVLKLSDTPSESTSDLILTSSVSNNILTLTATPDENVRIYYSDSDFNLNEYFQNVFLELEYNSDSLKFNLITLSLNDDVNFYKSPIILSSDKKINAIALDYDKVVLSNYLEDVSLTSNPIQPSDPIPSNITTTSNIKISPVVKTGTGYFCTETNICYFNESASSLNNFKINVSGTDETNFKFYSDVLNQTKLNLIKNKLNITSSPSNNSSINFGGGLTGNVSLNGSHFSIRGVVNNNYFISVGLDGVNFDKLYLVKLSGSDYNSLIQFNIYKKIINDVYCSDCKIPDWMPDGIILELSNNNNLECNYPDLYKVLCDFNIFDLNNQIGIETIPDGSSTGTNYFSDLKDTYFEELKVRYPNDINSIYNSIVKLFLSESKNTSLTESDLKNLFSIINAESGFDKMAIGDKTNSHGPSYGLVQLNKELKDTQEEYNKLDSYLPQEFKGFDKYKKYFLDISGNIPVDNNYSVYLAFAVYQVNKVYLTSEINNYQNYSNMDQLFMIFYSHQIGLSATKTFFNGYNKSNPVIMDCVNNANKYNTAENRLNCIAVIGSVRKMAWYVFADNNWDSLNNLGVVPLKKCGGLPYILIKNKPLCISPINNDAEKVEWGSNKIKTAAISKYDGLSNTNTIVAAYGTGTSSAARLCSELSYMGYTDWYLPAKNQLLALYTTGNSGVVKGDFAESWIDFNKYYYWSSTEYISSHAYVISMNNGNINANNKGYYHFVRCVRDP